ncbi:MAG TPA: cytochrome P450 [Jatrophihabitantaceae bacterium]
MTVDGLPPGPRLPVGVQTLLFGKYRHRYLPAMHRRYGDLFTLRIAPHARRLVLISKPEDIRTVFTGSTEVFHAGEGNAILGPVMGHHSVLLLDESEHLRIRQLLMPAFNGAALRGYRDLVAGLARTEIKRWPVGRTFRAHDRMSELTLEVILQVVFGVTDERRLAELRPPVGRVVDINPIVMLGWFYPRLQRVWPWRQFADIQREFDRLLYAEIAARRQADLTDRSDVLSRLLAGGGLTDAEVRDNLVTLLLAGHETTATALAWALHELARRPDVLRRAQQAADEGDDAYLEAVVKESLRLHPVIYEVARKLKAPVEVGGYRLPTGATVMPAIGIVQSDPRHYPDPDDFDPTRFLGDPPPPNTWIPFGGGVRRCLGAGFSLMEATEILRELLRGYDVRPARARPEAPISRNVTLAPARGTQVIVTHRDLSCPNG